MSDLQCIVGTTTTTGNNSLKRKEKQMAKTIEAPTVGSQFTTAKSKVTGEVQEVVKNANGSYRVRLDVNGQPRWTTLTKQLIQVWVGCLFTVFAPPSNCQTSLIR